MTDPQDRLSAPRQVALLFAVAGILALVDTVTGVGAPGIILVVGLTDLAIAAMLWLLPWHRWPRRLLTTFVVLTAFPIIGLTYLYAEPHPFIYPIFFLMVFLWIGLAERPGTSLVLAPVTAIAVFLPLHLRGGVIAEEVVGTVALVATCVLVGEVLSRVVRTMRRAQEDYEHRAEALRLEEERRLAAERAREEKQSQLADAQRIADVGSFDWNLVEDRLDWSDQLFRICGFEPQSFDPTLERFIETLHPEDRERIQAELQAAMAEVRPFAYEYRVVRPNGEVRVCQAHGEVSTDSEGNVTRVAGTAQDITERKEIERVLDYQRNQLAEAQRLADVGSYDWDLVEDRLEWSDQLFRICGFEPQSFAPTLERFIETLHPEDRERIQAELQAAMAEVRPFAYEYRVVRPDGEVRVCQAHGEVSADAGGNVTRVAGTAQDITDRKQVERELVHAKEAAEAANRTKSDFLSSMSHELRTPLNSVIGFANVLGKNKAGNLGDQDLMYLERILANGRHLLDLINDVLDLSKVEVGKVELHMERVPVAALVAETLDELSGAVRDKEIKLEADLPEGPALMDTDAGKLKQILINLVGNAIKFTDEGGVRVELKVDPDSHRPERIDVRDTGPGIPEDRLAAIFEAFEQAETGTARTYGGTGLGLAISAALADLLGYHLHVKSEVGVGSTFSVVFSPEGAVATAAEDREREPLPAPSSAPTVEPDVDTALAGELVLVIDDETDSRLLLTHHLEEVGCRTISASTGEQGLQMAREFRPSLITLDLLLPGMTGWEILRALKTDPELCEIPVVVVSVVADDNKRGLVGAVDVIQKPFERDALLRALRRCLASSSEVRRILIVDDEEDSREILRRYLDGETAEIRTARDGIEALEVLEDFKPDVVVLDLMMPKLDGMELIRKLDRREDCRDIPLVVVTAKDLTREEEAALSRHTEAVLKKGFALEQELRAALREIRGLP